MNHEQAVRDLYAAFQRQDMAAITALVAENVDWNNTGLSSRECPWNGDFSTRAKLPGFFQALGQNLDFTVFDLKAVAASGPHVAVQLHTEFEVRKNGRALAADSVHFWTFDDKGKISGYRHYNDTAAELAAWRD